MGDYSGNNLRGVDRNTVDSISSDLRPEIIALGSYRGRLADGRAIRHSHDDSLSPFKGLARLKDGDGLRIVWQSRVYGFREELMEREQRGRSIGEERYASRQGGLCHVKREGNLFCSTDSYRKPFASVCFAGQP